MEPLTSVFGDLGIALCIGALVGTERGRRGSDGQEHTLGLRTFMLIALAGAVSALTAEHLDQVWIFVGGLIAVTALIISGYLRSKGGLTTEFAAVLVFLLGGGVLYMGPEVPVAVAVITALVLASKNQLHGMIEKLGEDDILAGLKLLICTFIVLPLLPREPIDPWGALNPYSLWWLVILIASISLVGYVAVRILGQNRGMALTGLFGGLVSSTAVTLSFAKRSKENPALSHALSAGVLIAWLTMAVRVLIEVAVVEISLLQDLVWPMLGIALPSGVAAALAWRKTSKDPGTEGDTSPGDAVEPKDVQLKNPFSLLGAIKFGALFAVVLVAVKLAQEYAPATGIYAVAALAGLTDVDAITLSLAQSVGEEGGISAIDATRGIILAAIANTCVKLGLLVSLGDRRMARWVGTATVAMVIGAVLGLVLMG